MSLFFLEVPFDQKEVVKAKGARWCKELKTWYIDDNYVSAKEFFEWIPKIKDTEFYNLYEIELEAPDLNYKVIMRVKSDKSLEDFGYFYDRKEKCWKKNYYLNFQYFDSRYPNVYDKKIRDLVERIKQDNVMDYGMKEKFISIFMERQEEIPPTCFKLIKKNDFDNIEIIDEE